MNRFEKCWDIDAGKGLAGTKSFPASIPEHISKLFIPNLPPYEDATDRTFRNVRI